MTLVTAHDTDLAADGEPVAPPLPPSQLVELAGLGEVEVRELPGPPGARTVILLHGWTASADINFFTAYERLGERFRVIAFDHRGHGSGLRTKRAFRLEDCADDVTRVADVLGVERFTPVGYSMGGAVAQLVWRRHRERVEALALCATAPHFAERREERLSFLGLTGLAVAGITVGIFLLRAGQPGWAAGVSFAPTVIIGVITLVALLK